MQRKNNPTTGPGRFYNAAFTLAEVLITLTIIGTIAALTIPTTVKNYQKTQALTRLKKAYLTLADSTMLAMAKYGPVTQWKVQDYNEGGAGQGSVAFANKYMVPYLKVGKNCENNKDGLCQAEWNYFNKTGKGYFSQDYSRFYLNDGTFVIVYTRNYDDVPNSLTYKYAYVYIDTNGQKKPNTFGKDIFRFIYYVYYGTADNPKNGKIVPLAHEVSIPNLISNQNSYNCNKETNGDYCAAVIMKQGWRMSEDYPPW